ncbi:MAG: glycerate kinase [Pseudomonadota bacterium]
MTVDDPQSILRALFDRAVAVADPMRVVPSALPERPAGRLVVVGAGKASARMAEAVETVWGPCDGLVITRYGYGRPTKGIEIFEAAHPVPDEAGARATERMLDLLAGLGPEDLVLALISGGGSALLTAPAGAITLQEKMAVNDALLRSGAPIDQMNVVRKHLSRVKAGQLAATAHPARVTTIMISDVPGDDPAAIASGPTVAEDSTPQDAQAILERYAIVVPAAVWGQLSKGSGAIPTGSPLLENTENRIVAAPSMSLEAAAGEARKAGLDVRILGDALEGEARDLGAEHADMALDIRGKLAAGAAPVLLLSGGECTVSGRGNGVGGPNAEYVLAAALRLEGAQDVHVLACDTDGVDGADEVAGAYAGPETLAQARAAGALPEGALDAHDSHGFFERAGTQIVTGPTLTNVNDFRAMLILPSG